MKEAFLVLLCAHLIGDFVFQSDWLNKKKDASFLWLLLHATIVAATTMLIAAYFEKSWNMLFYLAILATHFLIDLTKKLSRNNGLRSFALDQFGHLISIIVIACFWQNFANNNIWLSKIPICHCKAIFYYYMSLTFISGLILCVSVGSILVSKATKPLVKEIINNTGLINGGKYIGQLERALTFFLFLIGQVSVIGFLFAAKSILRFGEVKEHRKEAEYIIIGTFMSFGWAMLIAYLTKQALLLWKF